MRNEELTMKNIKYGITFGIALVCAMLFTTCDDLTDTPEIQKPVENGYGKISISFTGEEETLQTAAPAGTRTVLPPIVFDKYVYIFTKTGEEAGTEREPDNDGFFTVEVGSYTVAVQAYVGIEEPYALAATGVSSQFSVSSGGNTQVLVPLSRITALEGGKFSYTITFPADTEAVITLQKWPELDNVSLIPVDLTQGNGKTQTLELDAGTYLLTVLVSKTGFYAGINEAVHIFPSLSTVYIKNFVDNDLLALISLVIPAIGGVTVPATGRTPVTAITENAQYSGTVTWNGNPSVFASATQYTATITLTPKTGYNLQGVGANFFTIAGSTSVSNNANSGVITAVFPATNETINVAAIQGVTVPATGGTPVTAITENAQYSGTVTWNGNPSVFAAATQYTATITLTAKAGYTLQGVGANFFTVAGATSVSNNANSGVITAVFPATSIIEMVYVPGGSFQMGDVKNEGWSEEKPVHTVTLSGFYIGKYQVTQAQYQAVMGSNPSYFSSNTLVGETQGKRPVESVSWYDALVFCNRLSVSEGLNPAYSISGSTDPAVWIAANGGTVPTSSNATWNAVVIVAGSNGYRLPTEAEWEYACRAGTTTAYNTGDTISDNTGRYTTNSGSKTHEVGLKAANAWGLYDMHGNVYEWCWDWYSSSYYSSSPASNPVGASSGAYRVERGGGWYSSGRYLRSAYRNYDDGPGSRYGSGGLLGGVGFRLVRS